MGNQFGYKKYMKKEAQKDHSLVKIFLISFFGMLLVFTFVIKSFCLLKMQFRFALLLWVGAKCSR